MNFAKVYFRITIIKHTIFYKWVTVENWRNYFAKFLTKAKFRGRPNRKSLLFQHCPPSTPRQPPPALQTVA
jgi:hypothetical protein